MPLLFQLRRPLWCMLAVAALQVAACGGTPSLPETAIECAQVDGAELWGDNPAVADALISFPSETNTGGPETPRVLVIDASAGGMASAPTTGFVYLSLADGLRAHSDAEALLAADWHLGFKRAQLRVNGGTSGAGDVEITRVHGVPLDTISRADLVDVHWLTDHSLSDDCEVRRDPIGQPMTAIHDLNADNPSGSHSWYNYDPDGVAPMPDTVYAIRDAADSVWAFTINDWQDGVWTLSVLAL